MPSPSEKIEVGQEQRTGQSGGRVKPVFRFFCVATQALLIGLALLAQVVLSVRLPFASPRGEQPWLGLASAVVFIALLVFFEWGGRIANRRMRTVGFGLAWLSLFAMMVVAQSPWELTRSVQWLGATTTVYAIRPAIRIPLHLLYVLGPAFLIFAWMPAYPKKKRKNALLWGVLPWILAVSYYAYLLNLTPPVYNG